MNRTNIYLPDGLRDRLDDRAAREGVSRAELIRQLLTAGLQAAEDDVEGDVLALEAAFGVLDDWDAPARAGDDARARHLADLARW